jgi:hypothetical protein
MDAVAFKSGGHTLLELTSVTAAIEFCPTQKRTCLSEPDSLLHFATACELPICAQMAGYKSCYCIVKKYVTDL